MTWTRARARIRCGGCGARIVVGEAFRPLTVGPGVFCAACALRVLHETPADLPPLEAPPPSTVAGPLRELAARLRRQLGLDYKKAQSGDPER